MINKQSFLKDIRKGVGVKPPKDFIGGPAKPIEDKKRPQPILRPKPPGRPQPKPPVQPPYPPGGRIGRPVPTAPGDRRITPMPDIKLPRRRPISRRRTNLRKLTR
jgi:hypothetical protein